MPIARLHSLELVRKSDKASSTDEIIKSHLRVMIWRMPTAEAAKARSHLEDSVTLGKHPTME